MGISEWDDKTRTANGNLFDEARLPASPFVIGVK